VLNRLPPRYIMSERGLTRIAAESWLLDPDDGPARRTPRQPARRGADPKDPALLGMVQVLLMVNKAIEVVSSRRRSAPARKQQKTTKRKTEEMELEAGFWHNFPQIIGRVVDARGKTQVAGASVSLSAGRLGLLEAESGWTNPCTTNEATRGYFSLWPRALRDGAATRTFTLRFTFEHPDYESSTREYRYRSRGDIISDAELRLDRVINLGSQPMRRRSAG